MSRRLARRFTLGLGNALLFIALAAAALGIWAVRTQGGAAFVVAQLLARVPGEVQVGRVEGTLADGLTLYEVSWRNDTGMRADARVAAVHFALAPLLDRSLQVERLALGGVRVDMPEAGERTPLGVPTLRAPLSIDIAAAEVDDLVVVRGERQTVIDRVRSALAWQGTALTVRDLEVQAPTWRAGGSLQGTLEGDVPLRGTVNWALPESDLAGEADVEGTLASLEVGHRLRGAIAVDSRGRVALLGRIDPEFDLTHRCDSGCAGGATGLDDVELQQTGTLSDYAYTLQARVAAARIGASTLSARGRGSLSEVRIAALTLSGPAGNVEAGGRVQFAPQLDFDLSGRATKVDARRFSDKLRGTVATRFALTGSGTQALQLRLSSVSGTLNGYALQGDADIARRQAQWLVQRLNARVGDNLLSASGRLGTDSVQIDAQVDAPQLDQLASDLRGSVQGRVVVRGPRAAPVIDTDLRAADLEIAGWRIATADIDLEADADGAVSGELRATGVQRDARALGDASLQVGGTLDATDIGVDWRWQQNALDARLHVRRNDRGAVVTVRDATAALETVGNWTLGARFDVTIDGPNVAVGAHAWRQDDAGLTIEQISVAPDRFTLGATLTDLPLDPVNDLLRGGMQVSGRADGRLDLRRERGVWRGTVDWRQRDTQVRYNAGDGSQSLRLETVSVQGQIDDTDGRLDLSVRGDHGTLADATVSFRDVGGDATLEGEARAQIGELAWLGRLFPGSADVAGALTLDITARGPVREPDVGGRFEWRDGALSLSDLGTQLTDIRLVGEGTSTSRIALEGSAMAGGGRIELRGALDQPLTDARALTLAVTGRDVKIAGADGYEVWISPDLSVTADGERAEIDGRIDVPRARVRVKALPKGAVARARDVRVAGRADESAFELPVSGSVDLVLGDDVHIEALGLDSDVRGDVTATLQPGREPRFDGRLYLENGTFRAYGQDLTVDRGNLFFAGSIRNPTLDVQATRRIQDAGGAVVAGVRVTGPADSYRVDVYSEPALPPTEALSYLVLGRSSLDANGQDGETLSRAAFALGLSRSSPITTQIASGLGLDELSVAGDNLDDAELVAGKQLNDDLYVRFTYGVFSELGALLLRYRLSRRLALEVGSADVQSVDLLYSFEK